MKMRHRARSQKRSQTLRTLGPSLRAELEAVGKRLQGVLREMLDETLSRDKGDPAAIAD